MEIKRACQNTRGPIKFKARKEDRSMCANSEWGETRSSSGVAELGTVVSCLDGDGGRTPPQAHSIVNLLFLYVWASRFMGLK